MVDYYAISCEDFNKLEEAIGLLQFLVTRDAEKQPTNALYMRRVVESGEYKAACRAAKFLHLEGESVVQQCWFLRS